MNGWNTITFITTYLSKDDNDDMEFEAILKGVEAKMSEKILRYMYDTIKTDVKDTSGC